MPIVSLPLPPEAEARALLHLVLAHGDIVGEDAAGRAVVQLVLDRWTMDQLMSFDADAAELEDQGDSEPDDDAEENGPAAVLLQLVPPKVIRSRRKQA